MPSALLLTLCALFVARAAGTCYFPMEYQGEFSMQSSVNSRNSVQYSTINITATAIPIWGNCHRKIGNNFILVDQYMEISETNCFRCLHLKPRSKNVLQVSAFSNETISKCFINEASAEENCPTDQQLRSNSITEIILFKTKDAEGKIVGKEYCPIDGRYSFTYQLNDNGNIKHCKSRDSIIDFCPSGATLNMRFRDCPIQRYDLNLDCLGHWEGSRGQRYLILSDNRYSKPQYRCALYKRDSASGVINIAISRDSTCTTDLHNATHGYEALVLQPKSDNNWPPEVAVNTCRFPEWMVGDWENVRVEDNTITYKDHTSFTTYTMKCLSTMDSLDKFHVLAKTQCDESLFNCMKIHKRSNNILELQLGSNYSTKNDALSSCDESNFQDDAWVTQGRISNNVETACPISGKYTGTIPDNDDLCAKLWSDCDARELMYYQVSNCTTSEVYEEREYRCLGHWDENNLLYTYTQRHDVADGTYECFVGSIISDKDIFIKEAGEHCQRKIDPMRYGMNLFNEGTQGLYSCIGKGFTTQRPMPTKPWNINVSFPTIQDTDNSISIAHRLPHSLAFLLLPIVIVLF
ncbi:PREDICTED: uncharacterized protein LOC108567065 isoform X2 [Nicrophorus vespilloides]|uniref:Uncharacterized protein LOC108567065 isoform X2 n=1 Tax=Nicrophorus vespilloides TaxID=110193 RepID=A0ABM1N7G2_NICVS|nr:PREDICTED: uncharacterized protein LOC108567065 isoform X2 [Nicrophorus vespilloides]